MDFVDFSVEGVGREGGGASDTPSARGTSLVGPQPSVAATPDIGGVADSVSDSSVSS